MYSLSSYFHGIDLSSFLKLTSFKVPNGTADLLGFDLSYLKKQSWFSKPKGVILFIHGFNSSGHIWGTESEGFVSLALKNRYIPYAVEFSDSFGGSLINLANYDLAYSFNFVIETLKPAFSSKKFPKIHFVAHSMGGIITRYFLAKNFSHPKHSIEELKKLPLTSVALLSVPNHGMSKANSERVVKRLEKLVVEINAYSPTKYGLHLPENHFYQLLSGNNIFQGFFNDLSTNMWPEIYWMNFIAERDIVVEKKSSFFEPEEVTFLGKNFYQKEYDATHMRNPLESFTDSLKGKIPFFDTKVFPNFEDTKLDFLGYVIKGPIYANEDLLSDYFAKIASL